MLYLMNLSPCSNLLHFVTRPFVCMDIAVVATSYHIRDQIVAGLRSGKYRQLLVNFER